MDQLVKARSLALVASDVQFTATTVSQGCDTLMFRGQGTSFGTAVILPHGDISSVAELADKMQTAFRSAVPGYGISVTASPTNSDTQYIRVESNARFEISAHSAIARTVGLASVPLSGRQPLRASAFESEPPDANGLHAGTFPRTPYLGPERYLVLHLDVAGSLESPIDAANGAMATLLPGIVDVAQPLPCRTSYREFDRISVSITRVDGSMYDFRGCDHRLEFLIDTD